MDIGVLCRDSFVPDYADGEDGTTFGHSAATYHFSDFRRDVGSALETYFGVGAVSAGNKAFDVHETTYHVEADVAPFFEHRRYDESGRYLEGVALLPVSEYVWIRNWPAQHYENGIAKNAATSRRYQSVVRILKSLRNEMEQGGSVPAKAVTGFFLECLVWNVPNGALFSDTWDERVQAVLGHLWNHTKDVGKCGEWGEVSELKYLFRPDSRRGVAFAFVDRAWDYVGVR